VTSHSASSPHQRDSVVTLSHVSVFCQIPFSEPVQISHTVDRWKNAALVDSGIVCVFILEGSEKTEVSEMTSLSRIDVIVKTLLPQVAAQIGAVSTFGKETSSQDLHRITAAQKSCDRFFKGVHAIAVEEMMTDAVFEFIELMVGENFQPDVDGVWSWEFPDILGSASDLSVILLSLEGLAEIASVLKSKKRKAPEREEDGTRTSLNNEELIGAFPTLVGVS
jgi:hypothetical protein